MPRTQFKEWANDFSIGLYKWIENQKKTQGNIKSGKALIERLGLSPTTAKSAFAGESITATELYARVFCYTAIQEADPRQIPPRMVGTGIIKRAMSEEEWQTWLNLNQELYQFGTEISELDSRLSEITFTEVPTIGNKYNHSATVHEETQYLLKQVIVILQSLTESNDLTIGRFFTEFAQELIAIQRYINVLSIDDEADRKAILNAMEKYNQ